MNKEKNTTTLMFQDEMWSIIGSICKELKTDRSANQWNRSAWIGTTEQWIYVCAVLTYERSLKKGPQKTKYTAAIKTVKTATPEGRAELKQKYKDWLDLCRAKKQQQ